MNLKKYLVAASFAAGTAFFSVPAEAQYYNYNYRVTPQYGGGYQVRDNYGNYSNYTPQYGGGYRYRNSSGGYGSITPQYGGGYRVRGYY